MIIFDTNALFQLRRDTPEFDLLRAFKNASSETAGVPWIVREELVAHQVVPYVAAYEAAVNAINALNRKTPWRVGPVEVPLRELEEAKQHWRNEYAEVLTVVETSGEAAKAALAREAYIEKPAKIVGDKNKFKTGARDVAIWLSVIDYLKEHPEEDVFFVGNNHRDFGRGADYVSPMLEDIGEMASRLHFLPKFDDFIARFTQEIAVSEASAKQLLSSLGSDSIASVGSRAFTVLTDGRFEGTLHEGGAFESCQWQGWVIEPAAFLHAVNSASGHQIGDAEWYTAVVDWILVGLANLVSLPNWGGASPFVRVACRWRTKVLFSTGVGQPVQVVSSEYPKALDVNDPAELQPLIDIEESVPDEQSTVLGGASPAVLAPFLQGLVFPPSFYENLTKGMVVPPSFYENLTKGMVLPPSFFENLTKGLKFPSSTAANPETDPSGEDDEVADADTEAEEDGSDDDEQPQ